MTSESVVCEGGTFTPVEPDPRSVALGLQIVSKVQHYCNPTIIYCGDLAIEDPLMTTIINGVASTLNTHPPEEALGEIEAANRSRMEGIERGVSAQEIKVLIFDQMAANPYLLPSTHVAERLIELFRTHNTPESAIQSHERELRLLGILGDRTINAITEHLKTYVHSEKPSVFVYLDPNRDAYKPGMIDLLLLAFAADSVPDLLIPILANAINLAAFK